MKKRYRAYFAINFSEGALLGEQVREGTKSIIEMITKFNEKCLWRIEKLREGLERYTTIVETEGIPPEQKDRYEKLVTQIKESIEKMTSQIKENNRITDRLNGPGSFVSKLNYIKHIREHLGNECGA